jgi:hypothetical protein
MESMSQRPKDGQVMAHASLSVEGRIQTGLVSISCSQRQFGEICAGMGIPVSSSLISLCLGGKRSFTPWTGEQLIGLLSELLALKDYFHDIPISWSAYERVCTLVVKRRVEQAGADVDRAAAVKA